MNFNWAASCAFLAIFGVAQGAADRHFDFGPSASPVAKGFIGVDAAAAYTKERGYGWSLGAPADYASVKPERSQAKYTHLDPFFYYDEMTNDLRRDGVESASPFSFRIDLPKGRYHVLATVGHLNEPRYSVDIYANGQLAAKRVDARHWLSSERGMLYRAMGYYRRVEFVAEVGDKSLVLDFKGDDSEYQRLYAIEKAKKPEERPKDPRTGGTLDEENAPWNDIGGPFSKISLMGLEVYPDIPLPLAIDPGSLELSASGAAAPDPAAQKAVAAFNAKNFKDAEKAFSSVSDPLVRGLGLLALAGRPDYENEYENMPRAVEALREAAKAPDSNPAVRETLEAAEIFLNGLKIYRDQAVPPRNGPRSRWNAIAEFNESAPQDFLYYKSLVYQGRLLNTQDPHHWGWPGQEGDRMLRIVEAKFPDNRFAQYRLHGKWKPFGDGTRPSDWFLPDYEARVKDSPEWVKAIYPAFQVSLDWAEWWIKFRQQADGGIGGGWGDDVELVGAIGYMGFVSRGMSDLVIEGAEKLIEGVWSHSEVDPELGFCLPIADAEHSAEWTGNTLGMMVVLQYGNPAWIERSMKTGKLLRDLWTDYNAKGRRFFRAAWFGAAEVSTNPEEMDDFWIDYRAARPASAVFSYNRNPAIGKLYQELGDAWLAVSLSTQRGKPRGIIPGAVSFPDELIGGQGSLTWYGAYKPGETEGTNWSEGGYKEYIYDVLLTAYKSSGNPKYLEPLRLEYELAVKHGQSPVLKGGGALQKVADPRLSAEAQKAKAAAAKAKATPAPAAVDAKPGSEAWAGANIKGALRWLVEKRKMEGRKGPLKNKLTKDDVIVAGLFAHKEFMRSWPFRTTEAGPTDRVAFVGFINPYLVYTGGRIGGALLEAAVTYNDTTRDFAAAVIGNDPQGLRILYHSLTPDKREVGILPWQLEPGGRYKLRYGPDANEDEQIDSVTEEREFDFPQLGTEIRITVAPRVTYVVEVEQTSRGRAAVLAPDPALTEDDIRCRDGRVLARIHNVGSSPVRNVEVAAYDGDPASGGIKIGHGTIPNIEAPVDLEPRTTTIGFPWNPGKNEHEIYIVVDPEHKIAGEITTFNNMAHRKLAEQVE